MRGDTRAHPEVNMPRGVILSDFSPSGWLQSHLPRTTDQNHSEDSDLGALFHHAGSRPHQREGSNNHRTRGKHSPEYPGQALFTVNSNQSTDQERIRAQTSGPTSPTKVQIPEGRITRLLHSSKQRPHTER